MTFTRLLSAVSFTSGLALASTASANLIVNPGFETGSIAPSSQWIDFGGPTNWTTTTADFHTGSYSATDQGNKLIRQAFVATPVSDITNVSFWVKNPSQLPSAYYLEYSDASNGSAIFPTTGQWQYVDVTAALTPGKSLVAIGIWGYSAGGTTERTYTDDWNVSATPEPSSLALLGVALIGRRRRCAAVSRSNS